MIFTCSTLGCGKAAVVIGKCITHAKSEVRQIEAERAVEKIQEPLPPEVRKQKLTSAWAMLPEEKREKKIERIMKQLRQGFEIRATEDSAFIIKSEVNRLFYPKELFQEIKDRGLLEYVGSTPRGRKTEIYKLKEEVCQTQ